MSDDVHMTASAPDPSGTGGRWTDLRWLVNADPERVLGVPASEADSDARLMAAVYRASVDVHRDVPPWVRRQLLSLDAARYGDRELSARIAAVPVEDVDAEPWRVLWSTGVQSDPQFQMNPSGHTGGVNGRPPRRGHRQRGPDGPGAGPGDRPAGRRTHERQRRQSGRWRQRWWAVGRTSSRPPTGRYGCGTWPPDTRRASCRGSTVRSGVWARLSSRGDRVRSPATTTYPCESGIWPVENRSAS